MIRRTLGSMAVGAGLLMALDAGAATLALDFTGGTAVNAASRTWGWRFTVNAPFDVDTLGVFDVGSTGSNTLQSNHDVGIWSCSNSGCTAGALIASGTVFGAGSATPSSIVETSASGLGAWVFEQIADVTLAAGEYVIGAVMGAGDAFVRDTTTITTDPALDWTARRLSGTTASLAFPFFTNSTTNGGYFAANFQIVDDQPPPMPEPGMLAMLGLGLFGLGYAARRTKD